jgi:hypothetical protein
MKVIDKLVTEWAYRCKKGYPDMNNPDDLRVFESTFGVTLKEERLGVSSKKAVEVLLAKYPETFSRLANTMRIGNKAKISQDQFLAIIKDTFGADAEVLPPNSQGNSQQSHPKGSSKYTRYTFKSSNGDVSLILAGGPREENSERQEVNILTAVNSVRGVKTVEGSNGVSIEHVVSAAKIPTTTKIEPIADLELIRQGSETPYKISAKGHATPTVAGGGLAGMSLMSDEVKKFVVDFYNDAYKHYKEIFDNHPELTYETDLYKTRFFKDVNREIPNNILLEILRGTAAQGGPVDAYYIGDMDHVLVGVEENTVKLSGRIIPVEDLAKNTTLYAHIKKRAGSYFFTDSTQTVNGVTLPRIFAQRPNGTTSQSKLGTSFGTRGSVLI